MLANISIKQPYLHGNLDGVVLDMIVKCYYCYI